MIPNVDKPITDPTPAATAFPTPETSEASTAIYTLVGFLVVVGSLIAVYWFVLKPRYILFVPREGTVVSTSAAPQVQGVETENSQEQSDLTKEDELTDIQRELDETVIDDFSDNLNNIKSAIDRL